MSRKVLELEGEIKRIKFNSVKSERSEGKGVSDQVKKKEIELEKVGSKQNFMDNEISFDHNDDKNSTSTPKKKKEIVLESEAQEEFLSCNKCNYKCKKGTILRKHMITKHEEHPCKECDMKLKTFMDLFQHVAKHHLKEGAVNDMDETEVENYNEKGIGDQDETEKFFKFKESMLDESSLKYIYQSSISSMKVGLFFIYKDKLKLQSKSFTCLKFPNSELFCQLPQQWCNNYCGQFHQKSKQRLIAEDPPQTNNQCLTANNKCLTADKQTTSA